MTPAHIEITDQESLADVDGILHDAIFRAEDAVYDEQSRTFRLLLWREEVALARYRKGLFLRRQELPYVRCRLEFEEVTVAQLQINDSLGGLDEYCLVDLRYDARQSAIRFDTMGPLRIRLDVTSLRGDLQDLGEPTWEGPESRPVRYA